MPGGLGGGLLTADTVRTIFVWQVAAQVLQALTAPFNARLTQDIWAQHPLNVLPPADLADMVLRGWETVDGGAAEAAMSGINAERFQKLVNNTGEPPGLQLLLEAYRRGFLPFEGAQGEPSVTYGVKTSRVRDEWIPLLERMRYTVPSAGDVIDAIVENQLDEQTARQKFSEAGLNPETDFDWMRSTRGRPPGPAELGDAANRGFIPWEGIGPDVTSFQQGVSESAVKDKWEQTLRRLAEYHPPPRTVTALLRAGSISEETALTLFEQSGLSAEMAAAYVADATHQKVAADKQLAKTEIATLYQDQAISAEQATQMLGGIGYNATEAGFLLLIEDLRRERKFLESAIGRVHSLYVARKIDKTAASDALHTLEIPEQQIVGLFDSWDLERTTAVRILTEAQIVDAWEFGVLTQEQAETELHAIGYTPFDAWVLLSIKAKQPLPNPPAQGPSLTGNIT